MMKVLKTLHIFTKNTAKILRLNATVAKSGDFNNFSSCIGSANGANFKTVGDILTQWRRKFEDNAISEPKESIEYIIAHCLNTENISNVYRKRNQILSEDKIKQIHTLCEKRLMRMPVQYVLGEWSFRGLKLKMSPPVFIPRPETEELVEIVSAVIARTDVTHILDLCCGSGAISLSLLQEHPTLTATGVDRSEAACLLTSENAETNKLNNRLRIIHSSLEELVYPEKLDIIVSNPPYVFRSDLTDLQAEIKLYEDLGALDGGQEGLDAIKLILKMASQCLRTNGRLFLEVDPRHPRLLRDYLISEKSLRYVGSRRDLMGKERFVEIIKV